MRAERAVTLEHPPTRATSSCAGGCLEKAGGVALWSESREVFRSVIDEDTTILTMPWAPRIDVLFEPRELANVSGGFVRIYARTSTMEVEIASASLIPPRPVILTAGFGCETYVIRALLVWTIPARGEPVECYTYARVYHGRL